jgi:hypothetical protein
MGIFMNPAKIKDTIQKLNETKRNMMLAEDRGELDTQTFENAVREIDVRIKKHTDSLLNLKKDIDPTTEKIAEILHNIWIEWSRVVASAETISESRLNRWMSMWVPYGNLTEAHKEQDRVYAERVVNLDTKIDKKLFILPREKKKRKYKKRKKVKKK